MNKGSTYENDVKARDDVSITKHELKISIGVGSYETFVRTMKTSEQAFMEIFAKQKTV